MAEQANNPLLRLHAERSAALTALGYRDGAPPPPLAVLYTALQVAPLRRVFAWAVPSEAALQAVAAAAHSSAGVVEVGAGTGYWSALLRRRGVCVAAYDAAPLDAPPGAPHNGHHALPGVAVPPPPFCAVRAADAAAAAAAHPDRAMLLCWPPPEDNEDPAASRRMACDALAAYQGDTLIFVGEGAPGVAVADDEQERVPATAGPVFQAALQADWSLQSHLPLPRWPSARDSLSVWRRRRRAAPAPSLPRAQAAPDNDGEPAGAAAARAKLLANLDAAWAQAAAAHILARAAAGGVRAAPGPEAAAVAAAAEGAPIWRRLLLRALC